MNAYTEFISKLCELAIKLKRVSLTDKEVENENLLIFSFVTDGIAKFVIIIA